MADSEKLISEGGGSSLPQPRSVTANPDVLKALRHLEERSSNTVIVESGKTSSGWWRKWSDGLIEQGGKTANATRDGLTVSFYKSFSSTNYYVLATVTEIDSNGKGNNEYGLTVAYPTSNGSFTVYLRAYENGFVIKPLFWYAAGY